MLGWFWGFGWFGGVVGFGGGGWGKGLGLGLGGLGGYSLIGLNRIEHDPLRTLHVRHGYAGSNTSIKIYKYIDF